MILEYYADIYKPTDPNINRECVQIITPKVTQYMNEMLMAQVMDEEIKGAVFDLGALKAPGPDGLSGLFYH